MECPECGYIMTAFDKVCPRCERERAAAKNPYVAFQQRRAHEQRRPEAAEAITPDFDPPAGAKETPAFQPPPSDQTWEDQAPPTVVLAHDPFPTAKLAFIAITVAVLALLLYNFLVVRPEITALRAQVSGLSQATSNNTRDLSNLTDTVNHNAGVANDNAATENYNNSQNSGY